MYNCEFMMHPFTKEDLQWHEGRTIFIAFQ